MASLDAGTSSGSKYQVFLSFRGPDTRTGFTDFLYHSLTDAGFSVFRDDDELPAGEMIGGSLEQAIDNSKIYIPIFSQNYAASHWCLRELARIVEKTSTSKGNKVILPIFVDVETDDVKLKTGRYCDAILKLKDEKNLSDEKVETWRKALKDVGAIKGWEAKKCNGQGQLIKLVVEDVVNKLRIKDRVVTEHLIGINDQAIEIRQLLDIDSDGVRLIKIHGMGGIGKTTLAKVVYNQLSCQFGQYCCFLEDVRMKSSRPDGLIELQKKLLFEIGVRTGIGSIDEIDYGIKRTKEVLGIKKVLIVLDDVDNDEQVEKLVGMSTLCSGSRILITTRNKDILQNYRTKYHLFPYEMEVMSIDNALQLFSEYAFDGDSSSKDYSDISRDIICATGRLPLALQVFGSLLYCKPRDMWKNTLNELIKTPPEDVFAKLKISYDALSLDQKQIFLDIACFFIGEDKTNAIYMWDDCGLLRNDGVNVLISMCLIKIAENNTFWMHDQLRDLGQEIVRREDVVNPEKRSRLWTHKEILDTIITKKMKNDVQALDLDLRESNLKDIISEDIGRFEDLRYLKLNGGNFSGGLPNCLTKLRWIFWSNPPRTSKPTYMHLNNVVILQFSNNYCIDDSNLQSLIKMARNLKVLSLESCHNMTKTPDFSGCPKLEKLTFKNCSNLREIDGSIGKLNRLTDLKIDTCLCLKGLPEEIGDLVNLKHLFIHQSNVEKLPNSIWKLNLLNICLEFEPI